MEEEDDIKFIDAEQYMGSKESPLTYELIVMHQIQRCVNEGSKEMIGGYIKHKQTSRGIVDEYVPDQRQIYMQSIMSLYDILLIKFDSEMEKADKQFKKMIDDLSAASKELMQQKVNISRGIDAINLKYQMHSGYMNINSIEFKSYIDEKLKAYRWLFQQLIRLFKRKAYLQADYIDDEHNRRMADDGNDSI